MWSGRQSSGKCRRKSFMRAAWGHIVLTPSSGQLGTKSCGTACLLMTSFSSRSICYINRSGHRPCYGRNSYMLSLIYRKRSALHLYMSMVKISMAMLLTWNVRWSLVTTMLTFKNLIEFRINYFHLIVKRFKITDTKVILEIHTSYRCKRIQVWCVGPNRPGDEV